MRRLLLVIALVAACKGKRGPKPPPVTQADCIAVRDHVADLVTTDMVAHPERLWDSLQSHDPAKDADLDAGLTRETFGAWLATERGKAWIAKSRARASSKFDDIVAKCVARATKDNITCWLGAKNITAFGQCPDPTTR